MLEFTETVLRDANQSLAATRMRIRDFADILPTIDRAGYYSVECWGGATFDACLRYLSEDPWERLRLMRRLMPNTRLQMLLRGRNLLGYTPYPSEVVHDFVRTAIRNGIDIIRIFDALNDLNNIQAALEATLAYGGHASCALCYTVSPVHSLAEYVRTAEEMERMGAMSICIKDMSGCLTPEAAYRLVRSLKDALSVPVILHTHNNSGLAQMSCLKAIEAGVDILDTAISSFSGGTSQPPTETTALTAQQCGKAVRLDFSALETINSHFQRVFDRLYASHDIDYHSLQIDFKALTTQIPGGMYSNLLSQMKMQGLEKRFSEILSEVPRVRRELGYPPLVTPISQMVAAQAVANVVSEERYQVVSNELVAYAAGKYGKIPGSMDDRLRRKILSHAVPSAKDAEQELLSLRSDCLSQGMSDEAMLTRVMFPQLAERFLARNGASSGGGSTERPLPRTDAEALSEADIPDFDFDEESDHRSSVRANIPGVVLNICVTVGETVRKGQTLMIVESMKMENSIIAPNVGSVEQIGVSVGEYVAKNQELFILKLSEAS